jgi:ferric-dicitrate binding protein FerR (iron transport regulator)
MKYRRTRCGAAYAAPLVRVFTLFAIHVAGSALAATPASTDITTRIDEQREVQLGRGTRVKLGPATHMRVREDGDRKSVEVVSGECTFEVDADSVQTVEVRSRGVIVNGGHSRFAVRHDSGGIAVLVLEGTAVVRRLTARLERVQLAVRRDSAAHRRDRSHAAPRVVGRTPVAGRRAPELRGRTAESREHAAARGGGSSARYNPDLWCVPAH